MKQPNIKLVTNEKIPQINIKQIAKALNQEYDTIHKDISNLIESCEGYSKTERKVTSKRRFRQSLRDKGLSWQNILYICPFYLNEPAFPLHESESQRYGSWSNPEANMGSILSIKIKPGLFSHKMKLSNNYSCYKYLVLICASVDGPSVSERYRMLYDSSKNQIIFRYQVKDEWYPVDIPTHDDCHAILENMYRMWVGSTWISIEYANHGSPYFSDLKNA